jgi:hypothetical protein
MSYLRYLCSLAHSGVQHILCCVFILFFFVLYTLCGQFLWIVTFLLYLQLFSYTNSVNKTCSLPQTTGGKAEEYIVFMRKSQWNTERNRTTQKYIQVVSSTPRQL